MEMETNDQKTAYKRISRAPISTALTLDLPAIIIKMKGSPDWKEGELKTEILLNSATRKIVLTLMHDKTEVESFNKDDSVSFKIIEGRMKFYSPLKTVILAEGQLLILRDKTRFTLTSLEESAFLLTIIPGTRRLQDN
jgi:hypothetical protein